MTPSRESLLDSIKPGMKLNKAFFMKVYGYEITTPGFANQALEKLKEIGCSKANYYYDTFANEYEEVHRQSMKEAARWYQNRKENAELIKNNNSREVSQWQDLQRKNDRELLTLLNQLKENGQL